jgi:hypothetical protein
MNRFYFSGIDRASFVELLSQEGASGMVNAAYAGGTSMLEAYDRYEEVKLALDSGSPQGNKDLSGYASLIKRIGSRFEWIANLDVIGDQEASDENWRTLKRLGANPLWIYQARGGKEIDWIAQYSDERMIGVGGLVPIVSNDANKACDLIGKIGRTLEFYGMKAHFFGVSSPLILREFAKSNWFSSADSQSWLSGIKSRELIRENGSRVKATEFGLKLTQMECAAQNIRQIHNWMSADSLQLSFLPGD